MPPKAITLTTEAFQVALERYIDETKPDPLARRQLESWTMKWENGMDNASTPTLEEELIDNRDDGYVSGDSVDVFTHRVLGTLIIQGDYVVVKLQFHCAWSHAGDTTTTTTCSSSQKSNDGILVYSCRVHSAKFCDKSDNDDKKEQKIRQKTISRLQQDTYLAKLVTMGNTQPSSSTFTTTTTTTTATTTVSSLDPLFLAKAKIHVDQTKNIMEERVDVSDIVAEALRRAVWNSSESSLDLVELILALPSLPGTRHHHHQGSSKENQHFETSPLADRAKLRLLEDAMLDECEKEGEGDLIQELSIDQGDDNEPRKEKQRRTINHNAKRKKSKSDR
jgi:hypothetical protein